jgi:5'-nucleotidase
VASRRRLCYRGVMTIRPVVLLDMDGVLADFDGHVNAVWPHDDMPLIPHEDRRDFYIAKDHPQYPRSLFSRIVQAPGFFRELPPMPGAMDAVEVLTERAEVYVCTAPMASAPSCADEKRAWIGEHMPGGHRYWAHRTIITNDKTLVYGDALVDDRPEVKGHRRPDWVHVLYRQPYNVERCDDPDGCDAWVSWVDDPYGATDIILHNAYIEAASRISGAVHRV